MQTCQCGKTKSVRPCASPDWQCDKLCGRGLSCGNHVCEQVCHKGPCGSCPRGGVRLCPCGKTGKFETKQFKLCVKKQPLVRKIKNMEVIPICLPVLSTDLVLYKMAVHREALSLIRVATVREKYLENEIFSRSGKSQGILWMAREI